MILRREERIWRCALGALVAAAALAALSPTLSNGFVVWDDDLYVLSNPHIRGLSLAHLRWMLTASRAGLWQPLTWLSLAIDHSLWGLEPAGYHLSSLLLHAATAVLFYAICLRLFAGEALAAAAAALFFAVHPLRVESVAWIAERKGLLSGFFFMLAALAHLHGRLRPALAAFALALSAKATALSLPLALLLLETLPPRRRSPRRVFVSLVPYFILAAAALLAALTAGKAAGTTADLNYLGAGWRLSRALFGLLFYPLKTLWPSALSPYYPPQPWFGRWSWELFAAVALAAAALAALRRWGKNRPGLITALACYAVLILPSLGFLQQGQLYAACDRFSYLSCLGFAALFGWGCSRLGPAGKTAAAAWLLALGLASRRQCEIWRDSRALWSAARERSPGGVATGNLGAVLADERLLSEALSQAPAQASVYENLGVLYQRQGREAQARHIWRRGLSEAPSPELNALLGASESSIPLLSAAVAQDPERSAWRADLGDALARSGRAAEAESQYAAALALEPGLGRAHNNWGLLLQSAGKKSAAVAHYQAALRDLTARAQAHHNWGNVLLEEKRAGPAERHYREALRINPRLAQAQVNLGNILARRGEFAKAAALYQAALKSNPRSVEARANLKALGY